MRIKKLDFKQIEELAKTQKNSRDSLEIKDPFFELILYMYNDIKDTKDITKILLECLNMIKN